MWGHGVEITRAFLRPFHLTISGTAARRSPTQTAQPGWGNHIGMRRRCRTEGLLNKDSAADRGLLDNREDLSFVLGFPHL